MSAWLLVVLGQVVLPRPIEAIERGALPPVVSPAMTFAYQLARGSPSAAGLLGDSVTALGIRVHLRFSRRVTVHETAAISAHGCSLVRGPEGQAAIVGSIADAVCPWGALATLGSIDALERVEPTWGGRPLRPALPPETVLNVAGVTPAIARSWPTLSDGAGVLIADMDSGLDPFQPMHFRADGGRFAWLDVDGDGVFQPEVDAVDLNGNGVADPGETVRMLRPKLYSEYTSQTYVLTGAFWPGIDWLYADENGNGQRDFGPQFTDAKPTFGEQLFVADDVDGSGMLEPGEPLVALGTPKVRAIYTDAHVYRRGTDLSQYTPPPGERHANMVIGTLVGGDLRLTHYPGVAPGADVVLAENNFSNQLAAAAWAQSEGAQLFMWEMANWFLEFLDGSSALETACDGLADQGLVQLAAAGNLGSAKKHLELGIAAGASADLPVFVPATSPSYFIASLLWRGTATGTFSIQWGGASLALSGTNGQAPLGTARATWSFDTSTRGTHKLDLYVELSGGRPVGNPTLSVSSTGSSELYLRGFLMDPDSGWSPGVAWSGAGVTDNGTYGTPAVGDKTLAVGSFRVDWPYQVPSGALAFYSSLGPRADGLDSIDFAAPEDLWTAPDEVKTFGGEVPPFGSYLVGKGTSNALPMAVGIAAVVRSAKPSLTGQQLAAALRAGAVQDTFTGPVPNDHWGWGKLSAYRVLTGIDATADLSPIAQGRAERHGDALVLDATGSFDPEQAALRIRWDVGDDGTWDVGPTSELKAELSGAGTTRWVRLEVADPQGETAAQLVPVHDVPPRTLAELGSPETLGSAPRACGCAAGDGSFVVGPGLMLLPLGAAVRRRRLRRHRRS